MFYVLKYSTFKELKPEQQIPIYTQRSRPIWYLLLFYTLLLKGAHGQIMEAENAHGRGGIIKRYKPSPI